MRHFGGNLPQRSFGQPVLHRLRQRGRTASSRTEGRAVRAPVAVTTGAAAGSDRCRHPLPHLPGLLEDGKLAHTGVSTASATAGMLNTEKRNNCGSQCANPVVHSMGTTTQRQNGFRTTESKWDTQKISTQEVAINVTKGIRQSDRRKTKNCAN
ncbi:brain and acute leukemia cytoplasmic protein isoform X2 [Chamaea fasciata]|uniref:brain and acute leukemia cytoplasmic protein isoform X2 n=1 Tax=Chamaea fasciata TaxID=190680 RepID=UPI00336AB132